MHIKEVKTAVKVGDFVLIQDHRNKIGITYLPIDNKILVDDSPRVYLMVENGVIKKIGGSAQRGGIKATMKFYTSSMTGSPGVPRFVLHRLIEIALTNRLKLELFIIRSPKVDVPVNGLFDQIKMKIASFKEMENRCKDDYYAKEGRYPDWNFQENHQPYPPDLAQEHVLYHQNRLSKKKAKLLAASK